MDKDFQIPSITDLYVADFENSSDTIRIYEYDIPLPKMPPKNSMVNHGRTLKNTIFQREDVPNVTGWDRHKKKAYAKVMHHKRENGEWQIIKGKPRYINGWAWEYINFWTTEAGGRPEFRWEAIEFFTFFDYCWRHPQCYGMYDIKGRRIGDTDKSMFLAASIATRYRKAWSGLMNKNEDDVKENFERIVEGVNNYPWFFKPIQPGSSRPKKVMYFDYPKEIYSRKKLKEKKNKEQGDETPMYEPLKSRIDYKPTTLGAYDGKRLALYHLDEPGKITAFDPNEQWGIVKPALAFENGSRIVGFAIFTTTVEDFENANTLENTKRLWDQSDPAKLNENGQTASGLFRVFRSAVLTGQRDRFGFPLREKTIKFIKNQKKSLEELGDYDGLVKFSRKHPLSIQDVFRPSHEDCILYPTLLDKRIAQIEDNVTPMGEKIDHQGNLVRPKAVVGDLVWSNGFGSPVRWQPNPNGRWHISQHPLEPNKQEQKAGKPSPANDINYVMGVDPIDHKSDVEIRKEKSVNDVNARSLAAMTVFRRFDPLADGELPVDKNGDVLPDYVHQMESDQYVCDYLFRPRSPFEFYEDALKTAIYYSVSMLVELDKPGVLNYFERNGYYAYLKRPPKSTRVGKRMTKRGVGIKASGSIIELYTDALQVHIYNRIDTYHHTRILECHRQFTGANRTKRDMTVACGITLLSNMDRIKKKVDQHSKRFDKPLWELYNTPTS